MPNTVSERTAACLDATARLNPALKGMITVNPAAMEDAAIADTNLDAGLLPAAGGIIVSVKDNIDTSGLRNWSAPVSKRGPHSRTWRALPARHRVSPPPSARLKAHRSGQWADPAPVANGGEQHTCIGMPLLLTDGVADGSARKVRRTPTGSAVPVVPIQTITLDALCAVMVDRNHQRNFSDQGFT